DLSELRYTQAVVRESLRLYPPAWYTPRTNVEEDVLDGVRIPAGSTVIVFQYLMHQDPQHWQDPHSFRPERFLDISSHPAYMPYGWGPRYCFAADYAHMMMTAFTALIARDYALRLKTPEPPRMDPLINLRMKEDLHLTMKPRA
ncbi:MAG: cytochrome P450, partial [Acidobacteriota bacterium]